MPIIGITAQCVACGTKTLVKTFRFKTYKAKLARAGWTEDRTTDQDGTIVVRYRCPLHPQPNWKER